MTFPVRTVIDRRLLLTVRMDPYVVQRLLPETLRPRLVQGSAVGGICFLRLRNLRPAGIPVPGVVTENVAHRFAVVREGGRGPEPGVYVPRRATSSLVASWLGGRLLEGELARASFTVEDTGARLSIRVAGRDGLRIEVAVRADPAESELFGSIEEESRFYQDACVAYSPNARRRTVEAVAMDSEPWIGTPVAVERFHSSAFEDATMFPAGSWSLDSAMLVRNVRATWRPAEPLAAGAARTSAPSRRG